MKKRTTKIIIICAVVVGVAIIASLLAYTVSLNMQHVSKWGITITSKKDPNAIEYSPEFSDENDQLKMNIRSKFNAPEPGESKTIDCADISGLTDTDISLDTEGRIFFDKDSFIKDGVFNCPLIFYLGKNKYGNDVVIDGQNYIGKKYDLEARFAFAFDVADTDYIPAKTDVNKLVDQQNSTYRCEFPKDREDLKSDNSKFTVELRFLAKRYDDSNH